MGAFKELSADVVLKALEGHQDILTAEATREEAFLRHVACPNCNGFQHSASIDPIRPFAPFSPLPQKILTCLSCQTVFNPRSGLIVRSSSGQPDPLAER